MERTDPARPAQANIFNSISEYKESNNPLALRTITKEAVTTSLFSRNPKVHGGIIAGQIQNFFVDRGNGQAFLEGKSTEELATFRKGLVKIIVNDPTSRDALTPHLEMVNQIGQARLALEEQPAVRRESSPKSSHRSNRSGKREAVESRHSSRSSKHSSRKQSSSMGASAARVTVAEPRSLSQSERVDAMIAWAQKEAHRAGHTFSESDITKLRVHAKIREPEDFQLMVKNIILIVDHKEKI